MCGICGEVRFDGATPSVSAISKMADILAEEAKLDVNALVEEAMGTLEVVKF